MRKNGGQNDIKIEKIYGKGLEIFEIKKFNDYINNSNKIKENINDEMVENSKKFAEFINEFEARIKENYQHNFKLNLELELINTEKKIMIQYIISKLYIPFMNQLKMKKWNIKKIMFL